MANRNVIILLALGGLAAASFGMSAWAQADRASHQAAMGRELARLRARAGRTQRRLRA